jgi:Elongation factor G, domain IV
MDYLDFWYKQVLERPSAVLQAPIVVEGLRDAHMAARWDYARVVFKIEPAQHFTFEIGCKNGVSFESVQGFLTAALIGLLDTILVADLTPYRNIRVTLMELQAHEINSNQLAFYRAGRIAGKRFLEEANKAAYRRPA